MTTLHLVRDVAFRCRSQSTWRCHLTWIDPHCELSQCLKRRHLISCCTYCPPAVDLRFLKNRVLCLFQMVSQNGKSPNLSRANWPLTPPPISLNSFLSLCRDFMESVGVAFEDASLVGFCSRGYFSLHNVSYYSELRETPPWKMPGIYAERTFGFFCFFFKGWSWSCAGKSCTLAK